DAAAVLTAAPVPSAAPPGSQSNDDGVEESGTVVRGGVSAVPPEAPAGPLPSPAAAVLARSSRRDGRPSPGAGSTSGAGSGVGIAGGGKSSDAGACSGA